MASSHIRPVDPPADTAAAAPAQLPLDAVHGDALPDEPTVISNRPQAASRGLAPAELGKLLAGEKLGHFELLEYAGGGGMGAVFRARDTMLAREVALKVLSRDQAADEDARRRFQNEAQSAARLDHDNIARVYYVGEDRGLNYIVFEYIEGVNVRELVDRNGPLPVGEAVSYALQVAEALEHASSRNVVHRDIKPSNILITAQGRAKLVDMGLARLHQVRPTEDLTASGVTLGTFDYISPEQARDPRSADVRSDIYSLGCTLFFMLTGRPPFAEGTVLQKLLQHNSDEPPDPRDFVPDLPEPIVVILRRMLAKEPRRRYQTPTELIDDLVLLADEVGVATSRTLLGRRGMGLGRHTSRLEAHLPWLVPVAALVLIVVALEWAWRPTQDTGPVQPPAWTARPAVPIPAPTGATAGPAATGPSTATLPPAPTAAAGPEEPLNPESETGRAGTELVALIGAGVQRLVTGAAGGTPPEIDAATGAESGDPQPAAPLLRPGLLVVSKVYSGPQYYASLRAACDAARSGDVIELQFDGPHVEKPIRLENPRLTIRAGDGHRPELVFRPTDAAPTSARHGMIQVVGGRLAVVNVALTFEAPRPDEIPTARWSLVELEQAERLELERCVLTVDHGRTGSSIYREPVTLVGVHAVPGREAMLMAETQPAEPPVQVMVRDTLARGETAFLQVDDLVSVELGWENGLAALSDPLVIARGGSALGRGAQVTVRLTHLTGAFRSPVFSMTSGFDGPTLPVLDIACRDSILLSLSGDPLMEQTSDEGIDALRPLVGWSGERNFYEGFGPAFWRFVDLDSADPPKELDYAAWREHWGPEREVLPTVDGVAWQDRPTAALDLSTVRPEQFFLTDQPLNPARRGASDGTDAGAAFGELPLPPEAMPGDEATRPVAR